MNYAKLLGDVKYEVIRLFHKHAQERLQYHNQAHTEYVVSKAGEIARFYELNDKDFFTVITAAWFHYIGYYTGGAYRHEIRSAEMAEVFLKGKGMDDAIIRQVKQCIRATCIPQQPNNLPEQIIGDADMYHLGTDQFVEINKKMRKEAEASCGKKISRHEWRVSTLKLLESHHYHTDYAKNLLENKKQENIRRIKFKESEASLEEASKLPETDEANALIQPAEPATIKKSKSDRPDRGIETMFRISSNNHQRLSDMADNKANIMITTTSIILSILLSVVLRRLEDNQQLLIPTILLLMVCVVTMVCAILATRPAIPDGRFSPQDIEEKKVNLLFFGNFYRMSYEEYSGGMGVMMNDREFLYGSLTRDLYSQGIVLGWKYRLLRIAYNVFMYGIITSVLAFVISVLLYMY
ncbi:MAG TPA: Pycsar system effector family protein [Segetibacter sp.]|nr:Pycsar system effector family protein [Segetibacter sp.]